MEGGDYCGYGYGCGSVIALRAHCHRSKRHFALALVRNVFVGIFKGLSRGEAPMIELRTPKAGKV